MYVLLYKVQLKWNNSEGWNAIVDYINKKGYEVYCIDLHGSFGNGNNFNSIPALDWTEIYLLKGA